MRLINADNIKFETLTVEKDTPSVKYRKKTSVALKKDINAMPTVDAEPVRHGKWIPWKYHDGFRCEICKEPVYNKYKYCPNCGAKMDGGENGK